MLDTQPNRGACIAQLKRLGGLPNFPSEKPALNELVVTMLTFCRDEEHVEATVSALVLVLEFAPRPIDIMDQATLIHEGAQEFPYCALCNTSGIAPVPRVVMIRGNPYSASDWCSCAKGGHLRADEARLVRLARAKRDAAEQRRQDKYATGPAHGVDFKSMAAGGEG